MLGMARNGCKWYHEVSRCPPCLLQAMITLITSVRARVLLVGVVGVLLDSSMNCLLHAVSERRVSLLCSYDTGLIGQICAVLKGETNQAKNDFLAVHVFITQDTYPMTRLAASPIG